MKVVLSRKDNSFKFVRGCCDDIIGFSEEYNDIEDNKYKVYYIPILEGEEMLDTDCWENVADWCNPSYIFYYGKDDSTITKAISKKIDGKHVGYGENLLEIGVNAKRVKQEQQLILGI